MSHRNLTLQVRPPRIVVLINREGRSTEFVSAARFLGQIWGGMHNPIIPVLSDECDTITTYRLVSNKPDFIFGINLKDEFWSKYLRKCCQPRAYLGLDDRMINDITELYRRHPIQLTSAAPALFANLANKSNRFAVGQLFKVVSIPDSHFLSPYYAAVFGRHPSDLCEELYDQELVFENPNICDLIDAKLEFWKHSYRSFLDIGSLGLTVKEVGGFNPEIVPSIVVVKSELLDLCWYWNLRTGTHRGSESWMLPVPESCLGDQLVVNRISQWITTYNNFVAETTYCKVRTAYPECTHIRFFIERLQPQLVNSNISIVDVEPPTNRLPVVVASEQAVVWSAELKRRVLKLVPPKPVTFTPRAKSDSWFVDILKDNETGRAVGESQFPDSAVTFEVLNGPCGRMIETPVIARFGDGANSINFRCTADDAEINLFLPTASDILEEILLENEFTPVHDEKRISYRVVFKLFGGLIETAKAVSGESGTVLDVLRSKKKSKTEKDVATTEGETHQQQNHDLRHCLPLNRIKQLCKFSTDPKQKNSLNDLLSNVFKRHSPRQKRLIEKRLKLISNQQPNTVQSLNRLLESWVSKNIVRRNWVFGKCERCRRVSNVEVFDLTKMPICNHCGNVLHVREKTEVAYSLAPNVRHALDEGLVTVALVGRFLKGLTSRGFLWLPGTKFESQNGCGDIDVLACCDGALVFAECKSLSKTPVGGQSWSKAKEQFLNLSSVAIKCNGDLLVFAAMVEEVPQNFQEEIRGELGDKINVLFLDNKDLQNGFRYENGDMGRRCIIQDFLENSLPEIKFNKKSGVRTVTFNGGTFRNSIREIK